MRESHAKNPVPLAILVLAVLVLTSAGTLVLQLGWHSQTPGDDQAKVRPADSDPPIHLHLSWSDDPQTTVTVMWQTAAATATSTVNYSIDLSLSLSATGAQSKPSWASGFIHTVLVTGLLPGTTYHYVAGDEVSGWSSTHTFKTAPADASSFTFAELGDTRNPAPLNYDFSGWDNVTNALSSMSSDFLMFLGDNVYDSTDQLAWDTWFPYAQRIAADMQFMEATGNHEYPSALSPNYRGQFSFPGSWNYYSFNYSSIHFIVLDNGYSAVTPIGPGSPQYDWLVADPQAADSDPTHPWKIVQFHKPPFCSLDSDIETRTAWAPLFEQYHVDLVFDGHKHLYERTYPIDALGNVMSTNKGTYEWSTPAGTIYITDGCAGAPLYSPAVPQAWSIVQDKQLGFTMLTYHADNNSLEVIHYNSSMVVVDSFWIVKPASEPIPELSVGLIVPVMAVLVVLIRREVHRHAG